MHGTHCLRARSSIDMTGMIPAVTVVVVLCYLVCAAVWSTTWFAIRVCIRAGDGYATFPAAALRFTIAAAILGAVVALGLGRPLPRGRRQIAWLVAAGVSN